jgi:hypothetical protein
MNINDLLNPDNSGSNNNNNNHQNNNQNNNPTPFESGVEKVRNQYHSGKRGSDIYSPSEARQGQYSINREEHLALRDRLITRHPDFYTYRDVNHIEKICTIANAGLPVRPLRRGTLLLDLTD